MGDSNGNGLRTEYEFTLPKGYVDAAGNLHQKGTMRMATAMDEIAPLRDPRVRDNQAYLTVAILARVVTKLGTLPEIQTSVIENLFTADLAYLQDLYRELNGSEEKLPQIVKCPNCEHEFPVVLEGVGEP